MTLSACSCSFNYKIGMQKCVDEFICQCLRTVDPICTSLQVVSLKCVKMSLYNHRWPSLHSCIIAVLIMSMNVDLCRWVHMSMFVYSWPCLYFFACGSIKMCLNEFICPCLHMVDPSCTWLYQDACR